MRRPSDECLVWRLYFAVSPCNAPRRLVDLTVEDVRGQWDYASCTSCRRCCMSELQARITCSDETEPVGLPALEHLGRPRREVVLQPLLEA